MKLVKLNWYRGRESLRKVREKYATRGPCFGFLGGLEVKGSHCLSVPLLLLLAVPGESLGSLPSMYRERGIKGDEVIGFCAALNLKLCC